MTGSSITGLPATSARAAQLPQPTAMTAAPRAASSSSKDPAQLAAQAAATAGVTTPATLGAFASFLTGRTSTAAFWAVTGSGAAGTLPNPALTWVTFSEDGVPDFSAITAAGGKVTGALPPDGQSVVIWDVDGRRTVQYAVEIDRGDGSAPVLLKGVNVNCDSSVDRAGRADALACAAKMFAAMPNSLEEVRARCWAGRSAWTAPQRSIDLKA